MGTGSNGEQQAQIILTDLQRMGIFSNMLAWDACQSISSSNKRVAGDPQLFSVFQ